MRRSIGLTAVAALFAVACGPTTHTASDAGTNEIPPVGASAQALIGSEGGALTLEDFEIDIPAGALGEDTMISVTVIDEVVQDPFVGYTPVFRFEPAGITFDAPVTVRFPFAGDQDAATIFWTVGDGSAYAALDTRIEGGMAVAETTHFSRGFVGTACGGGGCCGRGRGTLDVLLSVDNSGSMSEEQASLAAEIPRLARVLATGDIDGDGVQDFPALRSVRVGSVSADMGTGGYAIPTCANSDFGDDGVLNTQGNGSMSGCMASYPSYAELAAGATTSEVDAFVEQVSCTAILGIDGCGFEQQLESVAKAVTSSSSMMSFHAGTTGHADGANAGFLRSDSVLATIVLTDENDCSASDPDLFNAASSTYGGTDLNLRCFAHGSALHPVTRYVDALRATRSNPDDVVFGLIAGIPVDLAGADPATILADPRMIERVDPAMGNRLVASCDEAGRGLAFPPTRMVEVARDIGTSTVQSICQEDFSPVIDAILTQVAARVSGSCGAP